MFDSSCKRNVAKFDWTCSHIKWKCWADYTMHLSHLLCNAWGKYKNKHRRTSTLRGCAPFSGSKINYVCSSIDRFSHRQREPLFHTDQSHKWIRHWFLPMARRTQFKETMQFQHKRWVNFTKYPNRHLFLFFVHFIVPNINQNATIISSIKIIRFQCSKFQCFLNKAIFFSLFHFLPNKILHNLYNIYSLLFVCVHSF